MTLPPQTDQYRSPDGLPVLPSHESELGIDSDFAPEPPLTGSTTHHSGASASARSGVGDGCTGRCCHPLTMLDTEPVQG